MFVAAWCACLRVALLICFAGASIAASPAVSLSGVVVSSDGFPIAAASLTLRGNGEPLVARTDAGGRFAFQNIPQGTYTIEVFAKGFVPIRGQVLSATAATTHLRFALPRQDAASIATIADVTANGTALLSTSPSPMTNINAQRFAAQGVQRASDILANELSTTVYPMVGGGLNAPAVVALRGPDPAETLVDVDGHQINNGNTGDFDLALLDPAELQSVQVVYGVAPSSLDGPNTLGGALNVVSVQPTLKAHTLERFSLGTFGDVGATLQATGTDARLGYAFSIRRFVSNGQLHDYSFPNTTGVAGESIGTSSIGNAMAATSELANIRYLFGDGGFAGISIHNQVAYRDLSAALSSQNASGSSSNFSGSSIGSRDAAYALDLELPLARSAANAPAPTLTFRHQTSSNAQSVAGPAAGSSPYLYNNRDLIDDDTLEFDQPLSNGSVSVKADVMNEHLLTQSIRPEGADPAFSLAQKQRWIAARYLWDPTPKLHFAGAGYFSDFTTFGHSFDPRFGFVWTPGADTSVRFSIGRTFQSPQLPEFIVPGPTTPIPVVGGYATIGNPHVTAEHATTYDAGIEHLFRPNGHALHLAVDLYRTNDRGGSSIFFGPKPCDSATVRLIDRPSCLSYPINAAREVYQGVELHADYAINASTFIRAGYDVDSAYILSRPPDAADDIAPYVQDLGVPLHKVTLGFEHQAGTGLSYYAGLLYEGRYNELNLPPFATLRAGIAWRLRTFEIGLSGENLTSAYDFLVTRGNGGVPYPGLSGLRPTDAYPLAGRRFTLTLSHTT